MGDVPHDPPDLPSADDGDEDNVPLIPRAEPVRDTNPQTNIRVELPLSALVHPSAQYDNGKPALPLSSEKDAIASLMGPAEDWRRARKAAFTEIRLDSFAFYVNSALYPCEMRPLQHMATRFGHDRFYFDGVLNVGGVSHRVERVEVSELPVGNYGPLFATVRGQVWVRSRLNADSELYYRLGIPSREYARFHAPFLWVADLAKHAVDFAGAMLAQGRPVALRAFEAGFARWLAQTHAGSPAFARWRRQHPSPDFRASIAANIEFVWKEVNGVLGLKDARELPLFHETMNFSLYRQPAAATVPKVVRGHEEVMSTIVTPYTFSHMAIGAVLTAIRGAAVPALPCRLGSTPPKSRSPTPATTAPPPPRTPNPAHRRGPKSSPCFLPLAAIDQIKPGDTISTPRDPEGTTDTKWRAVASKGAAPDDRWFGLVQKVHVNDARDGRRTFDVIWFYRPADTPCCLMKYPWPNELFLSDHCTCEEGRRSRVREHQVLGVHRVDWFGGPGPGGGRVEGAAAGRDFFVRQTYLVAGRRWVSLQASHMLCAHDDGAQPRLGWGPGDTVLAAWPGKERADPYEVLKTFRQGEDMFVRLRKLLRRCEVDEKEEIYGYLVAGAGGWGGERQEAAPNELVYTDRAVVMKQENVVGRCVVRCFRTDEQIPTPYDRGGTGNLFYMTHRLVAGPDGSQRCVPFGQHERDGEEEVDSNGFPTSLRQGFDPASTSAVGGCRKLRGMDLFCGSGNFGRGLEEGGAVEMLWANDIWDRAIHTYMANSDTDAAADAGRRPPEPFLGSVDDLLLLALQGNYGPGVPRPGEVEFISAGSPCPGFSLLTQDKTTLAQIKNQSLVASFASFVDLYRPLYGVLENVATIVQTKRKRGGDVLSQLLCALVGMGYQAQLVLGDAWSHGAPQGRTRIFLCFAASGLALPSPPPLSHSHHPGVLARGVGEMANGEPFVARSAHPVPFRFVSASEATADLPYIGDGKPEPAVAFPDHRLCGSMTERLRHQIAAIPTHPYGMSFSKAWFGRRGAAWELEEGGGEEEAAEERESEMEMEWETRKAKGKDKAKGQVGGAGVMSEWDRELFPEAGLRVQPFSQGWRRTRPGDVFQTVTTRSQPTDARAGTGLHWDEDRPMTVLEMRRAQGFPDHEVLLGSTADQWKLVGNSVARQMALALGLRFREAWAGGLVDEGAGQGNRGGETGTGTSRTAPVEELVDPDMKARKARTECMMAVTAASRFGPRGPPEVITLDANGEVVPVSPPKAGHETDSNKSIDDNSTTDTSNNNNNNDNHKTTNNNTPQAASTTTPNAVSTTAATRSRSSTASSGTHKRKRAASINDNGLTPVKVKGKRGNRRTTTATGTGATTTPSTTNTTPTSGRSRSRSTTTSSTPRHSTTPIPAPSIPPEVFYAPS